MQHCATSEPEVEKSLLSFRVSLGVVECRSSTWSSICVSELGVSAVRLSFGIGKLRLLNLDLSSAPTSDSDIVALRGRTTTCREKNMLSR